MAAGEIVECDYCGKRIPLTANDTMRKHKWGHGIVCEYSGKRYPRHTGSFQVLQRDADGKATEWIAQCRCGRVWLGADPESVEKSWGEHAKAERSAA